MASTVALMEPSLFMKWTPKFFKGARRVPAGTTATSIRGASGEKERRAGIALELLRSMEGAVAPDQALRKGLEEWKERKYP